MILSQEPLDENVLRAAIDAACYTAGDIQTKTCEKKELFPFLKKQSVIFEEPPSGGFSSLTKPVFLRALLHNRKGFYK